MQQQRPRGVVVLHTQQGQKRNFRQSKLESCLVAKGEGLNQNI